MSSTSLVSDAFPAAASRRSPAVRLSRTEQQHQVAKALDGDALVVAKAADCPMRREGSCFCLSSVEHQHRNLLVPACVGDSGHRRNISGHARIKCPLKCRGKILPLYRGRAARLTAALPGHRRYQVSTSSGSPQVLEVGSVLTLVTSWVLRSPGKEALPAFRGHQSAWAACPHDRTIWAVRHRLLGLDFP